MACLVSLGVAGLYLTEGQNPTLDRRIFCAALGDRKPVPLTDGTRIELNSGACISTEIEAKSRIVRLESGEAIFRVARDPSRPFVVETGPISIEDVGTEFDVYRRESSTRVVVIEGAVQIASRGTNPQPLTALQQINVPDDTAQARVRRTIARDDFDRMTAWVHGDVEIENWTLKETMDEFARYQHFQTEFADPRIAEVRIGGRFHVTDLEGLLDLLKHGCIHSQYDKVAQRITFTTEAGKRPGDVCE
jgi:transmembrane sensor